MQGGESPDQPRQGEAPLDRGIISDVTIVIEIDEVVVS
jgi:hypothetical protein